MIFATVDRSLRQWNFNSCNGRVRDCNSLLLHPNTSRSAPQVRVSQFISSHAVRVGAWVFANNFRSPVSNNKCEFEKEPLRLCNSYFDAEVKLVTPKIVYKVVSPFTCCVFLAIPERAWSRENHPGNDVTARGSKRSICCA